MYVRMAPITKASRVGGKNLIILRKFIVIRSVFLFLREIKFLLQTQ